MEKPAEVTQPSGADGGQDPDAQASSSSSGRNSRMAFRVVKTVFMVLAPTVMGIYLELSGPTLQDLMDRVSANYEQISQALVARSVGYLLGSLISGVLSDRFPLHMELLLSGALLLGALGTFLAPWCRVLWLLALMFAVQGLGQGMIDTSNNTMCIVMWGKQAAAPIHALHFGFGIGAFIAPQLARPFIASRENSTDSNVTSAVNVTVEGESRIEVAYSISAILTLIWSAIFLGYYIYGRVTNGKHSAVPTEDKTQDEVKVKFKDRAKKILSPGSCTGGDIKFGIMFFTLIFFFYLNVVGGERAYGKFLYSYATDSDHKFSVDQASLLNSLFWICFTCGRAASIVAAKWILPAYLLLGELAFNLVCGIVLAIWGYSVPQVLWAFTGIFGFFLSPVFAAGMAFANQYVVMTGSAVAFVFIGSSAGGMVYQYLTGYLFEYHGPHTLMYVILGYALFLSAVFLLMLLLTWKRPTKYSQDQGQGHGKTYQLEEAGQNGRDVEESKFVMKDTL